MSWQIKLLNMTSRIFVKPFAKWATRQSKPGQEQLTIDKLRRRMCRFDHFIMRKHRSTIPVDAVDDFDGVDGEASYLWINNSPDVTRTILSLIHISEPTRPY